MRVLVADDSSTVRLTLRRLLQQEGYEVVLAEDGTQAWEALQRGEIRLAVLDWMMPGLDGVEVCRRLQAENQLRLVYVILLTSKTGNENIVAALQAGASDYLTKPFQSPELFARLRVGERICSLQLQLAQTEKLEAIGRLASGIAHEINTPTQFVGDNTRFLHDAYVDMQRLLAQHRELLEAARKAGQHADLVKSIDALTDEIDLVSLMDQIPRATEQTLEGVERVARIVRGLKEFSHPGPEDRKMPLQINRAIENTIAVSRSEWKDVAQVVSELDATLAPVPCLAGEIHQVLLNLIVNAAQTIGEAVQASGAQKGTITISTRKVGDHTEIRVKDTGLGIPDDIRLKIFDPFFTTKPIGKGTGQGLAIARTVVVEKHGGTLTFETELGKGTTFIVSLPNAGAAP